MCNHNVQALVFWDCIQVLSKPVVLERMFGERNVTATSLSLKFVFLIFWKQILFLVVKTLGLFHYFLSYSCDKKITVNYAGILSFQFSSWLPVPTADSDQPLIEIINAWYFTCFSQKVITFVVLDCKMKVIQTNTAKFYLIYWRMLLEIRNYVTM